MRNFWDQPETLDQRIERLASAGAKLSYQLRGGAFAKRGDHTSTLHIDRCAGRIRDLYEIWQLPGDSPLIDIAQVADLQGMIYPSPKILNWTVEDWAKEIRRRLTTPAAVERAIEAGRLRRK